MGGKRKQVAQRVKNNAKPSSSARSAELLSNGLNLGLLKGMPGSSSASSSSVLDPNLDPHFFVAFKGMGKKDATTKQKSLQEFIDLCKTSDIEVLKSVMPTWHKVYSVIYLDEDPKVREWAQMGQKAFSKTIGREMAPYLKKFFPVWFVSQYDTYPPTASVAQSSLEELFPSTKLTDVVVFCQEEILSYIEACLIHQSTLIFSNIELLSQEEREGRLERMVISCLQGYSLYLNKIPSDKFEKCLDQNKCITTSTQFWDLLHHNSSAVKSAWFNCIVAITNNSPQLLGDRRRKLIKTLFTSLTKVDMTVVSSVWEALLHYLVKIEDCWVDVNFEKEILPHLCKFLSKGAGGSVSTIFPSLLPLLSHIPYEAFPSKTTFFDKFFQSLCVGITKPAILSSHIECSVGSKTFLECINYAIKLNCDDIVFCTGLINDQLLPLLNNSCANPLCYQLVGPLYSHLVITLISWKKQGESELFSLLEQNLWQGLLGGFTETLGGALHDVQILQHVFKSHISLLQALRNPYLFENKSRAKVSFSDQPFMHQYTEETPPWCSDQVNYLLDFFTSLYLKGLSGSHSAEVELKFLTHLSSMVSLLGQEGLTIDLSPFLISSVGSDSSFDKRILPLIFVGQTPPAIQDSLLLKAVKMMGCVAITEAIKVSSGFRGSPKEKATAWFNGLFVRETLLTAVLSPNQSQEEIEFITASLTQTEGDFAVGSETVTCVLQSLSDNFDPSSDSFIKVFIVLDLCLNSAVAGFIQKNEESLTHLLLRISEHVLSETNEEIASKLPSWVGSTANHLPPEWSHNFLLEYTKELIKYLRQESNDSLNYLTMLTLNLVDSLICDNTVELVLDRLFKSCVIPKGNLECLLNHTVEVSGDHFLKDLTLDGITAVLGSSWNPLSGYKFILPVHVALFSTSLILHRGAAETLSLDIYFIEMAEIVALSEMLSKYYCRTQQWCQLKPLVAKLIDDLINLGQICRCHHLKSISTSLAQRPETEINLTLRRVAFEALSMPNDLPSLVLPTISDCSLEAIELWKLRKFLETSSADSLVSQALTNIMSTFRRESCAAFNKNFESLDSSEVVLSREISLLMKRLIDIDHSMLSPQCWDFCMIATSTWFLTAYNSGEILERKKEFFSFVLSTCNLLTSITKKLKSNDNLKVTLEEWEAVFAPDTYQCLISCWTSMAEKSLEHNIDPLEFFYLENMSLTVYNVADCPPLTNVDSKEIVERAKMYVKLLLSPSCGVRMSSLKLLLRLASPLVDYDASIDDISTQNVTCNILIETLKQCQTVVSTLLQEFGLGTSCILEPFTDSFTYTHAYLLLWYFLLKMCQVGSSQLRYTYTTWIREQCILQEFMANITKLMPANVVNPNFSKKSQEFFSKEAELTFGDWGSTELSHLSCQVFTSLLRTLPALVRQWTSETDPKTVGFIDKLTTNYVSHLLCSEEMQALKEQEKVLDNMKVVTHSALREVTATYTIEDASVELIIRLSPNHPLSPPKVEVPKPMSLSFTKQVPMQLTFFLNYQNGKIWDGLLLWKSNLDKKLEGVEECYVCFSIFHSQTFQLPKLVCSTCKKKFHSFCLFKWFTTSNRSTCPICRNLF